MRSFRRMELAVTPTPPVDLSLFNSTILKDIVADCENTSDCLRVGHLLAPRREPSFRYTNPFVDFYAAIVAKLTPLSSNPCHQRDVTF